MMTFIGGSIQKYLIMALYFFKNKERKKKRCRLLSNDGIFVTDDRVTRERNRFVFSPEFTSKGQTARNYLSSERNTNAQGALKKKKVARKNNELG